MSGQYAPLNVPNFPNFETPYLLLISALSEYCHLETFTAECKQNEVVQILQARYGRMKLGRCVRRGLGYIGCAANAKGIVDSVCSGRYKTCFRCQIKQSPALGTVRLIARKMMYVKCFSLCLRSLNCLSTWREKNIPHYSGSHCRCLFSQVSFTVKRRTFLILLGKVL